MNQPITRAKLQGGLQSSYSGFNCDDVANEERGIIGRVITMEKGGPFAKINCDQFRLLFAFAEKWVNKK